MSPVQRVFLVIMDSMGIGALPDAAEYGDRGADTFGHIAKAVGGLNVPNLERLGLGRLTNLHPDSLPKPVPLSGSYGRMAEVSKGKDTTTGHWEMAGVLIREPFPVYPHGFPPEVLLEFERRIGRKTLGNKAASGTEIIKELGEEHVKTGSPIVYTSADSVFQIAAHEEIISLEKLYAMCRTARAVLQGPHAVGRVIARPFIGKPGSFTRTPHRHDFSLEPFGETLLDHVKAAGQDSVSIGKIWDIFAGRGITRKIEAETNALVMQKTLEEIQGNGFKRGLLFANLVDFDMLYNHREDPKGSAVALEEFDRFLPKMLGALKEDDVLILAADHGNDPTDHSTDHSREYVPVLVYGKNVKPGVDLGVRKTFADCGQTIASLLGVPPIKAGESFAGDILP